MRQFDLPANRQPHCKWHSYSLTRTSFNCMCSFLPQYNMAASNYRGAGSCSRSVLQVVKLRSGLFCFLHASSNRLTSLWSRECQSYHSGIFFLFCSVKFVWFISNRDLKMVCEIPGHIQRKKTWMNVPSQTFC